jgi:hypothetical protein
MSISTAVSGGFLLDFFTGTWIDISHILFVDDTLIFYEINPNQLCNILAWLILMFGLFLCFKAMSVLKTNLAKSKLIPNENVDKN